MITNFYLVATSGGSVKAVKTKPTLAMNEVCILVNMELPEVLFKKPQITATIKIDHEQAQPFSIDADTSSTVKDAIEAATGLNITLKVQNPE